MSVQKYLFSKIVKHDGNGKTWQGIEINTGLFLFSFYIEQVSPIKAKGLISLKLFKEKRLIDLKFGTNSTDLELIRHVFLFGKEYSS